MALAQHADFAGGASLGTRRSLSHIGVCDSSCMQDMPIEAVRGLGVLGAGCERGFASESIPPQVRRSL